MTDEEINRKFEIVAGHLATLAVRVDKLAEKTEAIADAQRKAEERWGRTEESIRALLSVSEIHSQEMRELGEAVRRVDERQRRTDDRLDTLINVVERYISERRNGRSKEEG